MQSVVTMESSEKRTAILTTTLEIVAERGFHDAPIALIAKRSGVSAGIIYHYFKDKDDLIHALYKQIKVAWSAGLMVGDPPRMAWPDKLFRLWRNAYDFCVTHPKETLFLEQYENSPYAAHAFDHLQTDPNMQALYGMIRDGFERGFIKPMAFEVLYELTLGVALGLAKRHIIGTLQLTEAELAWVAVACYRAVQP